MGYEDHRRPVRCRAACPAFDTKDVFIPHRARAPERLAVSHERLASNTTTNRCNRETKAIQWQRIVVDDGAPKRTTALVLAMGLEILRATTNRQTP